jgi:phosphohistidine phosphatase SixA
MTEVKKEEAVQVPVPSETSCDDDNQAKTKTPTTSTTTTTTTATTTTTTTTADPTTKDVPAALNDSYIRPSLKVYMIRHAESYNNEVYTNARAMYHGGTSHFDPIGWQHYVDQHRTADPGLSQRGLQQADRLAHYLVPHLLSIDDTDTDTTPIHIITSPMKRTCTTIRPTLQGLCHNTNAMVNVTVLVHGFYFESEGCHTNDIPEDGMTPTEITDFLSQPPPPPSSSSSSSSSSPNVMEINFVGFPKPNRGWYCNGTGPETRTESEQRATKFYMWLCDYLDTQLYGTKQHHHATTCHQNTATVSPTTTTTTTTTPKRHVQLLMGHGDFMSLLLQRIVSGFGHTVETMGIPHRTAFVHYNTGITELEYFGHGRFLLMSQNATPHLLQLPLHCDLKHTTDNSSRSSSSSSTNNNSLLSGGSLKDGWSYLMPSILEAEVSMAFSDDELEDHVLEQRNALKALYLSSTESEALLSTINNTNLIVEQDIKSTKNTASVISNRLHHNNTILEKDDNPLLPRPPPRQQQQEQQQPQRHFIVKRGLQVVGVASYSERTGHVFDVAVRPSAGKDVAEVLFNAVKDHSKTIGRSGSLLVFPRTDESKQLFESVGFAEVSCDTTDYMEFIHE